MLPIIKRATNNPSHRRKPVSRLLILVDSGFRRNDEMGNIGGALKSIFLTLLLVLSGPLLAVEGDSVGETIFARGAVTAQNGSEIRVLGKGEAVYGLDVITAGPASFAVIKMTDGTRLSLRPDSVFSIDEFDATPGSEAASLKLIKGGVRSITGSISKQNPEAFKVYTAAATIGIRGTEFDARLCEQDCAAEGSEAATGKPAPAADKVAGRVLFIRGQLTATQAGGGQRRLSLGAPVYSGEQLETAADSYGVLVFRDGTRITLKAETRFDIENYAYQAAQPERDSTFFRLVRGGVRALTGAIADRNPDAFKVYTATATIGIRGTGFDLLWLGACVGTATNCGLVAFVWLGDILAENDTGIAPVLLDQAARIRGLNLLPEFIEIPPDFADAPRPDTLPVDLENLFGSTAMTSLEPGLYVACYEGYCAMLQEGREIDLGAGEAGFASPDGQRLWRLERIDPFQLNDPFLNNINNDSFSFFAMLNDTITVEGEYECALE